MCQIIQLLSETYNSQWNIDLRLHQQKHTAADVKTSEETSETDIVRTLTFFRELYASELCKFTLTSIGGDHISMFLKSLFQKIQISCDLFALLLP